MDNKEELKEIFDELKKEHDIENLASFTDLDIADKLKTNEITTIRYKELYYKELQIYEELERKMEALKGLRYKHYKFNEDHEWSKYEIEKYCFPTDKSIIQMNKIMDKQLVRVRFFEMCFKSLEKLSWNMHTFSKRELGGI